MKEKICTYFFIKPPEADNFLLGCEDVNFFKLKKNNNIHSQEHILFHLELIRSNLLTPLPTKQNQNKTNKKNIMFRYFR